MAPVAEVSFGSPVRLRSGPWGGVPEGGRELDLVWSLGRGLLIGFAIAAAIGPIGLLCIRRTLVHGRLVGAVSGLGAATADAVYASIAAFGLTAISDVLVGERRVLGVAGGGFLVILAVHSLLRPSEAAGDAQPRTLASAYSSTVLLTIANPATILSFTAAFIGLGLAGHSTPIAGALVLGVFAGSAAWWIVLAIAVAAFRSRLGPMGLRRLAAGSSALIGLLGLLAIAASVAA
jgi:threonine/homoserine/homoserine lactone efflux protein